MFKTAELNQILQICISQQAPEDGLRQFIIHKNVHIEAIILCLKMVRCLLTENSIYMIQLEIKGDVTNWPYRFYPIVFPNLNKKIIDIASWITLVTYMFGSDYNIPRQSPITINHVVKYLNRHLNFFKCDNENYLFFKLNVYSLYIQVPIQKASILKYFTGCFFVDFKVFKECYLCQKINLISHFLL